MIRERGSQEHLATNMDRGGARLGQLDPPEMFWS